MMRAARASSIHIQPPRGLTGGRLIAVSAVLGLIFALVMPLAAASAVAIPPAPDLADGAVDFTGLDVTSYGLRPNPQDLSGGATVADDGRTLVLSGNTWKKVPLDTVIGADTVLQFDFYGAVEGEIHAIGFDNDNWYSESVSFEVAGVTPWGIEDFAGYTVGDGWVHYTIPIGEYYTGSFSHLFFINDDDAAEAAVTAFANVVVGTPPPPPAPELTPAPELAEGAVDFTSLDVTSYGTSPAAQDLSGGATIADDGRTFVLDGNTWKRVPLDTMITVDTVLEFDFFATVEGEIHGLGFDNDTAYAQSVTFQIAGTTPWGLQDFADGYTVGEDEWVHYTIPIGQYYTGTFSHMFFVNDDDAAAAAEAAFANVVITTPPAPAYDPAAPELAEGAIDFTGLDVTSYGSSPAPQDLSGGATVADAGRTLVLSGNTWKRVPLDTVITADTVLDFDFYGAVEGEIHGLGFDNDTAYAQSVTFELAGVTPWGIQDFAGYTVGDGWVHYTIPIGDYYTGSFSHMFFVNDDDAAEAAETAFANVVVGTPPPPEPLELTPAPELAEGAVDFTGLAVTSYGTSPAAQDLSGGATVADDGRTLVLSGNTWKKVPLDTVITADTVLEFDFFGVVEGEIHGLGFDNDNAYAQSVTFEVGGTTPWGLQDFADGYTVGEDEWVHYTIPIGQYYTGAFSHMFFVNDDDAAAAAEAAFANIVITTPEPPAYDPPAPESAQGAVDFRLLGVTPYGSTPSPQDLSGGATVADGGRTLVLSGNTWKKVSLPTQITANTVIDFDFYGAVEGEIHGLGFDNDNGYAQSVTFELAGVTPWGIQDFVGYTVGDGWVHYTIPIGQYYTGTFSYLYFINDDDAAAVAEAAFANIVISNGSTA